MNPDDRAVRLSGSTLEALYIPWEGMISRLDFPYGDWGTVSPYNLPVALALSNTGS